MISVAVSLISLFKEIRGVEHTELHSEEVVKRIFFHVRRFVSTLRHQLLHYILKFLLRKNSQHIKRHFAYLIVLADNEHDLVGVFGPTAVLTDKLVLLVEKRLIVYHFRHDAKTAHRAHHFTDARKGVTHIVEYLGGADLCLSVGGEYLKVKVVGVLNIADRVLELIVIFVDIRLELFKVVADRCRHSRHHSSERVVHVNFVGVKLIGINFRHLGHSRQHGGKVLRLLLNSQRIGGKRILLNSVDVRLYSV